MESPSVDQFIEAAREYCRFAECEGPVDGTDLWLVRDLLLRLIYHIPAVERAAHSAEHVGARPDDDAYSAATDRFRGFPFDFYKLVFDPHDLSGSDHPVTGMLTDDLADIYRDLAEGLDNASQGHLPSACLDWSESYRTHWARHATNALTAIEIRRTDRDERIELNRQSEVEEIQIPESTSPPSG